jgi:hypothetical protein
MEVFWNLLRVRRTEVDINRSRMNDFYSYGASTLSYGVQLQPYGLTHT